MSLQHPGGWRSFLDWLGQSWSTVSEQGMGRQTGRQPSRKCGVHSGGWRYHSMERMPSTGTQYTPMCSSGQGSSGPAWVPMWLREGIENSDLSQDIGPHYLSYCCSQELKKTCSQMLEKAAASRHLALLKNMGQAPKQQPCSPRAWQMKRWNGERTPCSSSLSPAPTNGKI